MKRLYSTCYVAGYYRYRQVHVVLIVCVRFMITSEVTWAIPSKSTHLRSSSLKNEAK